MKIKCTTAALLLSILSCLGLAACSGSADTGPAPLAGETIAKLMQRSENRVPDGAGAPSFVIDPGWPKPLPNN
ncbi:MAG: hypothetical protein PVF63_09050, partial [Gammaproteobacteria bacterium]